MAGADDHARGGRSVSCPARNRRPGPRAGVCGVLSRPPVANARGIRSRLTAWSSDGARRALPKQSPGRPPRCSPDRSITCVSLGRDDGRCRLVVLSRAACRTRPSLPSDRAPGSVGVRATTTIPASIRCRCATSRGPGRCAARGAPAASGGSPTPAARPRLGRPGLPGGGSLPARVPVRQPEGPSVRGAQPQIRKPYPRCPQGSAPSGSRGPASEHHACARCHSP